MKNYDIIVAGGGASGLCAAIEAKRTAPGLRVAVLEKLPRAGKKLLATGNGRCNMTNFHASEKNYNAPDFVRHAINVYSVKSNLDFFRSMGLLTVSDGEGRVYPMSGTAASVVDALRFEARRLNVEMICDTPVSSAEKSGGRFVLNGDYEAARLILSTGGRASPAHGSDGSGYQLLAALGHRVTDVFPSLVQIRADSAFTRPLKGIRVSAGIEIHIGGRCADESSGEILFTDYGLSGIAAMEVSRVVSAWQNGSKKERCTAVLCMIPALTRSEATDFIAETTRRDPSLAIEDLLTGVLPKRLAQAVCKGVLPYKLTDPAGKLTTPQILALSNEIKGKSIDVQGVNGFAEAQVTAGGGALDGFDSATMMSRKIENLYACGELLDVDGGCGGYNLQWAWSSGRLAGRSAAMLEI
ncbi:MAG: aminoacetone oxidase family FAD-binding enzyme [Oscillospiraceae bacterium]|nr:aminoacetone oxidase family FAD-binding enzyme [Oscillospiraceae bacterium]